MGFEALDSTRHADRGLRRHPVRRRQACAIVPSGASTGRHEAHERRDGGDRYAGRGARDAVAAVNGEIAAKLHGHDAAEQDVVDAALRDLDGTPALSRLGANAVLAASVACALAAAEAARTPLWRLLDPDSAPLLPRPMVNVLSGGAHAGRAVDVQDVLVIPLAATTFAEAIEHAALVRTGAPPSCGSAATGRRSSPTRAGWRRRSPPTTRHSRSGRERSSAPASRPHSRSTSPRRSWATATATGSSARIAISTAPPWSV